MVPNGLTWSQWVPLDLTWSHLVSPLSCSAVLQHFSRERDDPAVEGVRGAEPRCRGRHQGGRDLAGGSRRPARGMQATLWNVLVVQ